jgi:MoaA/NifB/PqqE/SkfB family radical SAM enzyme
MSRDEIREVLVQAGELGARKIVLLGGEPSIYPHLVEMLNFLSDRDFTVEMFTNGSGVTPELAQVLADHRVRVVVKMNSRDEAVQVRVSEEDGTDEVVLIPKTPARPATRPVPKARPARAKKKPQRAPLAAKRRKR